MEYSLNTIIPLQPVGNYHHIKHRDPLVGQITGFGKLWPKALKYTKYWKTSRIMIPPLPPLDSQFMQEKSEFAMKHDKPITRAGGRKIKR